MATTSAQQPLLSIVAATRNDDHGENLLRRTQTFLNALISQSKRHELPIELILVEWNPPADRPRLVDALRWPEDPGPCQIRIITVPRYLHQRRAHSSALPFFQMIAKNVGIRRARGRFILATNIDILLSDEIAEFLAAGKLEPGKLYRTDRVDVMADVPVDGSLFEQLDYCRTHLLRVNARDGTFALRQRGDYRLPAPEDVVSPDAHLFLGNGWFLPMSAPGNPPSSPLQKGGNRGVTNGERFRLLQRDAVIDLLGPANSNLLLTLELEPAVENYYRPPIELQIRDASGAVQARGFVEARQRLHFAIPYEPGRLQRLRLHVPQAVGSPHDPTRAALRVYKVAWSPVPTSGRVPRNNDFCFTEHLFESPRPRDVAVAEDGIHFGGNWWQPEHEPRGLFRWATGDALLEVSQTQPRDLCLEIEPGPGVGRRPFELEVWDVDDERVLARGWVTGHQLIRLRLPSDASGTRQLRLRALGGGLRASAEDNRVLNFRVYRFDWAAPVVPAVAADTPEDHFLTESLSLGQRCWRGLRAALRAVPRRTGLAWRRLWQHSRSDTPIPPAAQETTTGLPFPLHTNACGDFTLLDRENWHALRGYPEFDMYSLHIDSFFCYMAAAAGLEEVVLEQPMCAYHIEHSLGSGVTPEGEPLLLDRMARRNIPVLKWPQVTAWGFEMRRNARPTIHNDEDWGFGSMALEETDIGGSQRAEVKGQRSEVRTHQIAGN